MLKNEGSITRRRLMRVAGASIVGLNGAHADVVHAHLPAGANSIVLLQDPDPRKPLSVIGKGAAFTFGEQKKTSYGCREWIKDLVIDEDRDAAVAHKMKLKLKDQENYKVKGCCLSSAQVTVYFKGSDPANPNYYVLAARARKDTSSGQLVFQPDEIWISKTEFSDVLTGYIRQHMETICDAVLP